MKFSILVPTLNEEKYIGILLNSLAKQSHSNFEVIVVDGKSTDKTLDVVKSFKEHLNVKTIVSDRRGVSYQRNLAVKNARNDHLVFFDADVKPEERFLEKLRGQIEQHGFDMATSWNVPSSSRLADRLLFGAFNIFYLELFKNFLPGAVGTFIYIRKNVFLNVGGFDQEIIFAEDFDLVRRLHREGFKYKLLRDPKIHFSVRRLEKEGRLNFVMKMLKAGIYYHTNSLEIFKDLSQVNEKLGKHKFGEYS